MQPCLFCTRRNADESVDCSVCGAMLPRFDLPGNSSEERFPAVRRDDVTWHPEMVSLALQGRRAEALKLYRARTGGGAIEALRALAAVDQGLPMTIRKSGVSEGTSQEADLLNLLRRGEKSAAVALYRKSTGSSLTEARESIERLVVRHGVAQRGAGCLGLLALVLATLLIEWRLAG